MRNFTKLLFATLVAFAFSFSAHAQCTNTIDTFPFVEDFEDGSFNSIWSGDIATGTGNNSPGWQVDANGTPSGSTGPSEASSGTFYAYTETSGGTTGIQNDTMDLDGPCFAFPANSAPYITFDYHMYAANGATSMGSLALLVNDNPNSSNNWTTVWSDTGSTDTTWQSAAIDLSAYSGDTISLRWFALTGSSGTAWQGDRAIDNIHISTGLDITAPTCPSSTDGSITASAVFGSGSGYTYSWSNSATTATISGLGAGTYTVTITNTSSSTTKVLSTTLTGIPTPSNLLASTSAFCVNDSLTVTLSIDYVDGDATFRDTTDAQSDLGTQNSAGATMNFEHVGTPALATSNGTLTMFYRGDMEAAAEYVTTYSENGSSIGVTDQTPQQCAGFFSSKSFSLAADSINVWAQNDTISLTGVPFGMARYCGTGATRYSWQALYILEYKYTSSIPYWFESSCDTVVANAVGSGFFVDVEPTATTTYYVRFYNPSCDEWGDCDSITITVNPQPTVAVSPSSATYCGTAVSLTASGASTYAWSPTTGLNQGTGANVLASPASSTTYIVTGTDANTCTNIATAAITVTSGPSVSISSSSNVSCFGDSDGSATASATGGSGSYNYAWSNGGTTATITNLTAGTYTVTVDDGNCTGTASVTISQPSSPLTVALFPNNIACSGFNSGSIFSSVSGGTSSYSRLWSTGATTATISGLSAGTYTLTVTDNNGCTAVEDTVVTQPTSSPSASISSTTNVSCFGGNDGSATVTATGGTPGYTYAWSNGQTSATATNLTSGTYLVTVSDANGCVDVTAAFISQPSSAVSASISSSTNATCFGSSDGSATASGSGGTGTITFAWSSGSTNTTATGLTAGTYTVTATDANGCTDTESVTITEPVTVSATFSTTNVSCNGGNDGSATASGTGGSGTYTSYVWSNGGSSATINSLTAGTYTVTATDNNGCTGTASVSITEPTSVVASITPSNVSCNGGNDGSATASATGGTGSMNYAWSTGATTATATGLTAGTYTVTATDANGCTDTESTTITEPTAVSVTITSSTDVLCNGDATGAATASASGGTGSISYSWSNGATGTTASSLTAGTYTVTATDANGCTDTESVTISEPATAVTASTASTNVSCNGGSDGTATASGSGGTGTITFAWSTGASTAGITGLTAGTYTVTATDANGCTTTANATITEPTAVSVSISASNANCSGAADGTATASGSGGTGTITFAWSTGGTSATITGLTAGTYTVTATDANGCTDTESTTITEPTPVAASITATNVSCNGGADGAATASATGGTGTITFAWSTGGTSATITGLVAGTYTVTATDANGCTDTESVTITEPTALSAAISSSTNVSCNAGNDGAATAAGSGGTPSYSFAWSNGATNATASSLTAGTYTVTVTDANGCTDTETVTITEPTAVSASTASTNVSCNGGSDGTATASGSGGTGTITFAWSTGASTAGITGLTAGTYTVTATDANGCTTTANATITEPTAVSVSISASNANCSGAADGTATASGSGGTGTITFAWSTGATTATITSLTAGTYTVTATDANGCTDTESTTITEPTPVAASITATNVSCNGGADGAATASATGGTGTITFAWSTGGTSATITGLVAGTYTVTATDANGCTDTESVTITEPTALSAAISSSTNVSCNAGNDGAATAAGSGGTPSYSFAWSNGATNATASSLTAGTYTVTVTDANGCTDTETVTITEPTAVSASTASTNVSCNGGSDGTATASGSGGTGTITFAWSTGASTAGITGLTAGTYTVTATDANGCTTTANATITEPTAVSVSISASNANCSGAADGTATASGSGGTGTITFAWSTGATTATITSLTAGTYTVTATDANGCTDTESTTITEPTPVAASITATNVSCNGGADGAATASATGGTGTITFAWSTGGTSATITGLVAGTYTVTATDANGCTDTESVTITEPTALSAAISSSTNVSCNAGNDGAATAAGSGGTPSYSFAWSNGATNATASSLTAGTYTVTVTDANGCTDTETVTITEPTALTAATAVDSDVSCNGGNDGGATASASGGTTAYSFAWSNSSNTASITGLTAGTYTVTVTDANGCTDTETVTITEPNALIAATVTDSNVSCNDENDGGATASASGGTTAYSFAWSNGDNTASITGLTAGTYTVTITDANGCTDTETATITEPTTLSATIASSSNVSCNGGSDGSATAAGSGGTTSYSFAWSNGSTSVTASSLTAGTYTVTVTDANGCTDTESVTITEPTLLTVAIASQTDVSCNGANDGSATAAGSGGTPGYTYSWSSGASSATASGLAAATFTVTVTDANGCTATTSVTINEPAVLVASITSSDVSCNGGNDGSATASAVGGTTAYSFAWSNSASTATTTGLTAGTYTVTVTDANGCTDTETVTITEPTAVSASISSTDVSCNGGSDGTATASATGGTGSMSFAWSNGDNTATTTGLTAGTYTVTATDANGCTGTESVTIAEPTAVVASTSVTNVSCNGAADGTATASGSGGTPGYTYLWSTGASTATASNLGPGTYTVTVTDANGCTDTESATITQPAPLVASITSTDVSCNSGNDGTATASATGGTTAYAFAWSNSASTASITGLTAGTYTVTVTDANGCTDTETVTITEPTPLVAATAVDNNVSCNGLSDGGATASATGGTPGYSYAWNTGSTTASVSGLPAGTYSVTVTDANGCTDSASVIITEPTLLVAATTVDNNASCNGLSDGGATASATGGTPGYSFVWNTGSTTASVTGLPAGTYSVTVTDANGCTDSASVIITEPALLVAATSVDSNVSCNGGSDGGATASATGGTPGYAYAWNTGDVTASVTGLPAGTYSVTVTDANGCTDSASVIITEPAVLVAATAVNNDVSCNGGADGSASASATGGTTAYSFAWSNGDNTATTSTGLTAGTYTVTVTDANGCTDTETVTITEPTLLVASAALDNNVSCNGGSDGGATASAAGGTPGYSFVWNTGSTTASVSGLPAGTYSVTVTDANGCTDSASVIITEPTLLVAATAVDNNVSCNGLSDGGATASATGGTPGYSFVWNTGSTTASVTGLPAGTYSVTVTDANGCTDSASVIITEPAMLVAATTVDSNVSCNGLSDGGATASATGGTPGYAYAWNTGDVTASVTGLPAGTYSVTVTDANGCTDSASVIITEPAVLVAATAVNNDVSCNGGADGSATASATGGTTAYSFAWSNGDNTATTSTGLTAGTYTVTVTDANGCTDTETVTITEPTLLVAATVADSNVSCNSGSDGGATASATGGTPGYTFAWSNGDNTASITGITAGTYTVTVTDANGCTATETVTITEPTLLVAATAVDNNVSCNGGNDGGATASATGGTPGYSFAWSNGASTAGITGLTAGTYTVTTTDANGCTDSASVIITEPAVLVAATSVDNNVSCNGLSDGGATASATGGTPGYSFVWNTGSTTASVSGLPAGTYSVTVTDANGCTDSASVIITEPALLVAATSVDSNVSCNGGSDGGATASATGGTPGYAYAWNTGGVTASVTGLPAGTYSVTVTDANGCTDSASVTITEPTLLVASAALDNNVSCNGGSDGGATASAAGGTPGYSFVWNTGSTTASVSGLPAGTYSVTVTDANGCTDSASVIITEPTLLVAATTIDSNVSCNGLSDGGATASATGGTPGYSFVWNTGSTTASVTGLPAGTYSVTVTDANGCTDSASVIITEPAMLVAATTVDSNVSCNGGSDGGATASATGGTPGYAYAWNTGDVTASVTGLPAGTYSVTVTDANGCTDSASVIITEPAVLVAATAVNNDVSCNGGADGSATASATGGTTAYSFAWSNGDNTATTSTGLTAGTYTVTVTDANGCTDTETVTITEPTTLAIAAGVINNVVCYGETSGSAQSSATGGTSPYTFSWSNGTVNDTAMLAAGTWTAYVTDDNGCVDSTSVLITQPDSVQPIANLINNISCYGQTDGAGYVSTSGGTMPYTYVWSNSLGTNDSVANLGAGTYTVTATDFNGCMDTAQLIIIEPDSISNAFVANNISCNGLSDGSLISVPSGGTPGYTYNWSTSSTLDSIGGLTAGSYTVTVTDANGCTNDFTGTLTEPLVLVAFIVDEDSALCNGDSSGAALADATGGTTPYTYAWPSGFTASGASLSGLPAGSYVVTVTDNNGCTATDTANIFQPNVIVLSIDSSLDVTCVGGSDGYAEIGASGGTGTYSYLWPDASTGAINASLPAGTHCVTVTDANGCFDSICVTLIETNPLPVVDLGPDTVACGGTYVLDAGSASSFNWSGGQTSQVINASAAGIYAVTVTDANGCQNNDSVQVLFNPLLSFSVNTTQTACSSPTGSATITGLTGGGGYTISWSNGQVGGLTASNLGFGNYDVTVSDQNGCSLTQSFIITEMSGFTVTTTVTDVLCNSETNGQAVAAATGGVSPFTYDWSNSSTNDTLMGVGAGTYFVTVEDANGCHGYDTAIIGEPMAISISVASLNSACGDSTGVAIVSNVTPAGTYTYQWNDPFSQANDSALNIPAGLYDVTVTDANGCTGTSFAIVNNDNAPALAMATSNAFCENGTDGSASANPTGASPFTYAWSDASNQTTDTATALSDGLYFVTVTDVNGCVVIDSATIGFDNAAPAVDLGNDTTVCDNFLTLTPGSGYTTYVWSTSSSNASISVSSSGTYTVIVGDANGCLNVDSIQVTLFAPISFTSDVTNSYCTANTGSIAIDVLGGGGGYLFDWNTSDTNDTLTGLATGTYTLTITDNNGCTSESDYTIGYIDGPTVSIATTDATCFGEANGEATATAADGNPPYAYAWSNGTSNASTNGLMAGNYVMTLTDDSGCVIMEAFSIGEPVEIGISIAGIAPNCGMGNGEVFATVIDNQGPVTYLWNDTANSMTAGVDSLLAGFYTVTVTDSVGCSSFESIALSDSGSASLVMGSIDNNCSNEAIGQAFVTAYGDDPFTYLWNDTAGQMTDTAMNLAGGVYAVSVTDINGCVAIGSATVGSFNEAPVIDLGDDVVACEGSEVILTPGGGFATYFWTTGATTASVLATLNQTYDVIVTDVNGCSATDEVNVSFVTPPVVDLGPDTLVCTDVDSPTLTLDAGNGFSTYTWSTTEATQTIDVTTGGIYSVTVSNVPECSGSDQIIVVFDNCINVSSEAPGDRPAPSLSVYPNPNRGEFVIETSGLEAGAYSLKLVNLGGQLVMNQQVNVQAGIDSRTEVDLSQTARGVYILVFEGASVKMDGRVIIQ